MSLASHGDVFQGVENTVYYSWRGVLHSGCGNPLIHLLEGGEWRR